MRENFELPWERGGGGGDQVLKDCGSQQALSSHTNQDALDKLHMPKSHDSRRGPCVLGLVTIQESGSNLLEVMGASQSLLFLWETCATSQILLLDRRHGLPVVFEHLTTLKNLDYMTQHSPMHSPLGKPFHNRVTRVPCPINWFCVVLIF